MKILILNWRDIRNPFAGGAEISLMEHVKYWREQDAEVIWFSSSFPGSEKKETLDGIKIIRKGSVYTVHVWFFLYCLLGKFKKTDIIIDSFHFIPYFSLLYFRNAKVIALINEVAGKLWFSNLPYFFAVIGYFLEPFFIKLYKNNIFITGSDSAKIDIHALGIPSNNVYVVNHGVHIVSIDDEIKKTKSLTVVFLGRISQDKGIKDALMAYLQIKKVILDARMWIIGKEEKEGMFTAILNDIVGSENKDITYFGFVDQQKKFMLLKEATILIHPSEKEGWGLTVIEAASQGTPTIGYNVEGLRDSIHDKVSGYLVPPGDYGALSEQTIALYQDKNRYKEISRNAVNWSKKFRWEESVKKSWRIIEGEYKKNV